MLKMIKGVEIKNANELNEEFMVENDYVVGNINEDKIFNIINSFLEMQKEQVFLILEVPTKDTDTGDPHVAEYKDVYYLDNISVDTAKGLFNIFGNLFINDGLGEIGFGNHETNAEIMTDKYNMIAIYKGSDNISKYEELLKSNGIEKVEKIKTAWDSFTLETPGICKLVEEDGKTVYDAVEFLKEKAGLYFAERRKNIS